MKTCTRCNTEKPETEFAKKANSKDGLRPECKSCQKSDNQSWYTKNREKNIKRAQSWRDSNTDILEEQAKRAKQKRIQLKIQAINFLGGKCVDCGLQVDNYNWPVFQFHHLNPEEKEFNVCSKLYSSIEDIFDELNKCICLCANCHAMRETK
jgi:hypothetical protein